MSTSGLAREGLGWPSDGARNDGSTSGLGWPASPDGSIPATSSAVTADSVPVVIALSAATCDPISVLTPDLGRNSVRDLIPTLAVDLPADALHNSVSLAVSDLPGLGIPAKVSLAVSDLALGLVARPVPTMDLGARVEHVQEKMHESVTDSGRGSAAESVGEPLSRLAEDHGVHVVTDPTKATERTDLPTGDAVSRETAGNNGAEDLSERDQLAASLPVPESETPLAQAVAKDARRRISLRDKVFPKPDRTRILTVANQKGGVGKTTTTVNVAAALAQSGLRVLVVDADPQGNASTALGIDHHADVPSIYDVLVEERPLLDCVQECADVPHLWCVPATIDLAGAEIELVSLVARETRMEKALSLYIAGAAERGEDRLDYVLIDCPPSLGLLTVNALVAADEVLIPIQCEYYALEGLSQLLKNIEMIKSHLNPGLHVSTILLTMYDGRTRLSAQVAEEVRSHFPAQVLPTAVPRSVRISEAPSFGQTVMTYDPTSSGALSYLEAASELAERGVAPEQDASGRPIARSGNPGESS